MLIEEKCGGLTVLRMIEGQCPSGVKPTRTSRLSRRSTQSHLYAYINDVVIPAQKSPRQQRKSWTPGFEPPLGLLAVWETVEGTRHAESESIRTTGPRDSPLLGGDQ